MGDVVPYVNALVGLCATGTKCKNKYHLPDWAGFTRSEKAQCMFFLRTLYLRWRHRDQTPRAMAEMYLILLFSARRCAYDLKHASDALPPEVAGLSRVFNERARWWLKLFAPDQIKQYRIAMIEQIDKLERENFQLRAELRAAGIESKVPTNDPF